LLLLLDLLSAVVLLLVSSLLGIKHNIDKEGRS